jgi:thiol-disulfide isomerase/thioredoxin
MEESRLSNEAFGGITTGKTLPDFTAKDLNGMTYTGSIVRNKKVTFLDFWSLSCAPCLAEIPNLNRLYDMTKDDPDVQFFAVTPEPETLVKEAIKKYDMHFPVLLVPARDIYRLSFGEGYPLNMVLDKNGRVYTLISGGSMSPGPEVEIYWNWEIEKAAKGDTAIAYKPVQIPKNIPGITFIDSSKIHSLDALADYFKGQSVYIDLWASWCMPCREELKSKNEKIDSFLNKHKIARLYLSIDNPRGAEVWKSLVYEYQPAGYHLLTSVALYKDIKQRIYDNGNTIAVPKYIIIKNGKIVELNAFAPSDGQKLLNQLTEKLL